MGRGYDDYVEAPTGTYTLRQLRLGSNYSIRVGAGIEAGGFYTRGYVYSELSDPVYATPQERRMSLQVYARHCVFDTQDDFVKKY